MPVYNRRAFVWISIMGKDVTSSMDPHLISVTVLLKKGGASTAAIELDDRDASLPIPPDRAAVKIMLGWSGIGPTLPLNEHVKKIYGFSVPDKKIREKLEELPYQASGMQVVFMGTINSVESGFSRNGGGRRIWIECKSTSFKNDGKTPASMTLGHGQPNDGDGQQISIADFVANVGKNHGFNVITQGVDHIKRDFWAQDNESFFAMGQRLALAHGLNFEVWGNNAYFTDPDKLANGNDTPSIEAKWGMNLISWRIKPYSARAQWKGATAPFFDTWNGLWKSATQDIGGDGPFGNNAATASLPGSAPNAQAGEQMLGGMTTESREKRGTGWVIINGEPVCIPRATLIVQGARPGVDGSYRIDEAEHNYTRGGGFTTRCNVSHPQLNTADYLTSIGKLSTLEIEKQLAQEPFFPWQIGAPDAHVPQWFPDGYQVNEADNGVQVINPQGQEDWRPNE